MWWFTLGFAAGGVSLLLLLLAVRMKRTTYSGRTAKIKGYLDLIPNLSLSQRQQVQEIRSTFLPRVAAIRRQLREGRQELAHLLFNDPPDRLRIHSVSHEILALQAELEREVIEHILEEREILNKEQNQRFYEIILDQFASGSLGVHDVRSGRRD